MYTGHNQHLTACTLVLAKVTYNLHPLDGCPMFALVAYMG